MIVLGIETSCDDTGIAIVQTGHGLRAHALFSQIQSHALYGGVVPELASRDHLHRLTPLLETVFKNANLESRDLSAIAYTAGPGLIGPLLVGATFAKTLAYALKIPSIGIHHLEAHLMAVFLESPAPQFPFLALLVSGGHTLLVLVKELGSYQLLGESLDDAAGEAFDKVAKLLGLSYPGGPLLARLAEKGDPLRFTFPRPLLQKPGCDFSFSGLKSFTRRLLEQHPLLDEQTKADIAAGFQMAVVETLAEKCRRALEITQAKELIVAGGVAANQSLREAFKELTDKQNISLFFPRQNFCTDNGAMIAITGLMRLNCPKLCPPKEMSVKARWPLDELSH